jgi:hypothetical protein
MWPFKKKESADIAAQLTYVIHELVTQTVAELRKHPLEVTHNIRRNIPRPVNCTLVASDSHGREYRQWIDMRYQTAPEVQFPLAFMTGRDADIAEPPLRLRMELDYDPRDR